MDLNFTKDENFSELSTTDIPNDGNVILIQNQDNKKVSEFKIDKKPSLTSGNLSVDKVKVKVRPRLTENSPRRVPTDDLDLLSNPLKNMEKDNSEDASESSSKDYEDEEDSEEDNVSVSNNDTFFDLNSQMNFVNKNDDILSDENRTRDEEDDSISAVDEEDVDSDDEEEEDSDDEYEVREKSYEEIQQEKQELLFKLDRLDKAGYRCSRKYSMASNLEDLKFEYKKLKRQRDIEKSIKFSRKILMALVSGIEYLNGRFDPFDIKLNGWSENVMDGINDYDEVFEELHDKYSESVSVSPELKLLMMVAGSGFMFHLTHSLFKTASPSLNEILKQNPDIMKNISEAAAQNMGPKLGPQDDMLANMMRQGINMKMNKNNQTSSHFPSPASQNDTIDDIVNELSNNSSDCESDSGTRRNKRKNKGITLDL